MAIEDKYKPFWETEESQSSPPPTIGDDVEIKSEAEASLFSESRQGGQDTNSFMEYLANERREKNRKPKKVLEEYDVEEPARSLHTYQPDYTMSILKIIPIIIIIGVVLMLGVVVSNSISNTAELNTTGWSTTNNTTLTAIGGTINQFSLLNPIIMIITTGIALMIVTRRRSIFPFIITFLMAVTSIVFLNASPIVLTIPGITLFWKMRGWSMGSMA